MMVLEQEHCDIMIGMAMDILSFGIANNNHYYFNNYQPDPRTNIKSQLRPHAIRYLIENNLLESLGKGWYSVSELGIEACKKYTENCNHSWNEICDKHRDK